MAQPKYEVPASNPMSWFAQQIQTLQRGIDDASARATAAQKALADYRAISSVAMPPVGLVGSVDPWSSITKRGGMVTISWTGTAPSGGISQYAGIFVLPAGFRPLAATDSSNYFFGGAAYLSSWQGAPFYIGNDGTVRYLGGTAIGGSQQYGFSTTFQPRA